MSRIAKCPIVIPPNVDIILENYFISINGKNGKITHSINKNVSVYRIDNLLFFKNNNLNNSNGWAQAGTCRALVYSMIVGVTEGFFKKLQLIGVGYRVVEIKNNIINLSLGYSHIIKYKYPTDIFIESPSQTEIVIKGFNKQKIGQIAADLRSHRPPEPYKGKGIRYENEIVRIKEAKKK